MSGNPIYQVRDLRVSPVHERIGRPFKRAPFIYRVNLITEEEHEIG